MDSLNKKSTKGSVCECKECVLRELMSESFLENESKYVCKSKIEKNYKKGEVIVYEGEEINNLICIKEGLIKIYRTLNNNKEQIISISKAFDFSYLLNVFSDKKFNYSISAIEDSTVWFILLENIKKMIYKNGDYALSVINKLSFASNKIINNFLEIHSRNLSGRVALILLFFSREIYKSNTFVLPVSRKEIAELIGMTTENVIRIMSEFRNENIIRIHTKEIEIKDNKRLELIMEKG